MIVTRREAVELIKTSMKTDIPLEGEDLQKVIFAVNEDFQVRDWLLGMPARYELQDCFEWVQSVATKATKEDSVPFLTVQIMFGYEMDMDMSLLISMFEYVKEINPTYSLLKLFMNAAMAGWPAAAFSIMRNELDPKVINACEGEEGDTEIISKEEEIAGI